MALFQEGNKLAPGGAREGSGRPPSILKELAGKHREEALERLVFWMRSNDPTASVKAAQTILDRSDGKALQEIDISPLADLFDMMREKYK